MTAYVVKGGTVLRASGPRRENVRIEDGRVAAVGADLAADDAEVVDASGCWVGPGFVDVHVHFREPGFEHKEDIGTGSAAAAAGGFTAVVAMPNTDPPVDTAARARQIIDRGEQVGIVEVVPAGCITRDRRGFQLADLQAMFDAGVRMFSDDGDTVADAGLLRAAMERVGGLGGVISQHAVDPGLASGGHMHEGTVSDRLGMSGIPSAADDIVVARDLALVRLTGCRYHLQHVSTAGSVELARRAKEEGLPVTVEVTPHHLAFDHQEVETLDTSFKMMPPLRTSSDVEALRAALRTGVIDMVATDHAPHSAAEKHLPFTDAPNGVTGLEWAASVVNTVVAMDIERFFARMSLAPAALAGLDERQGLPVEPGGPANIVVFDPATEYVAQGTRSRSSNSPYLGRRWRGVVKATFAAGMRTYRDEGRR